MREKVKDLGRLYHINECIEHVINFLEGKTFEEMNNDVMCFHVPTYDEASELGKNCTWTWTIKDGVKGFEVTSKVNSNSIFLPAAGYYIGSSNSRAGDTVHFWTSSLNNSWNAWRLSSDNMNYLSYTFRYYGFPVRAVCP